MPGCHVGIWIASQGQLLGACDLLLAEAPAGALPGSFLLFSCSQADSQQLTGPSCMRLPSLALSLLQRRGRVATGGGR